MFLKTVILNIAILIAVISANEDGAQTHIEVKQNFRKIGNIATGLSYAHIHATVKFGKLKHAVNSVIKVLKIRQEQSTSEVEKGYIATIQPQLQIAKANLDNLQDLFFGENDVRSKRQIFLGLAIALGIFNTGMSIFNTAEIVKIHSQITGLQTDMIEGFEHVAHILNEEQHVLYQIVNNVNLIKETCRYALDQIQNEQEEIRTLQNIVGLGALVSNLNAELAAWGRGLESLSHGQMHPTLINKTAMKKAFDSVQLQASQIGLQTLHKDWKSIYKTKLSYFSTKKEEIVIILHIPLVEQSPLEIFEYLPVPFTMDKMFVTIEGDNNILATDLLGQHGLEMSSTDLLRCQTEDIHHGKLFICPDTNLSQNQIRKSCLGSIFFGHQQEVVKQCHHFIHLFEQQTEFMKQISDDTVVLFSKEDLTVRQTCHKITKTLVNITGLTSITVKPGCKVTTEQYTFTSPTAFKIESDFIVKTMRIPMIHFTDGHESAELTSKLQELMKNKTPERIHLDTLKNWIRQEKTKTAQQAFGHGTSSAAILCSVAVVVVFLILYWRYKKISKKTNPTKNDNDDSNKSKA